MSNDIRHILERLAAVEDKKITPVSVNKGLNSQQKSADQLPALFKPRNISPTLTKKPYQKHPMDGKLVGGESIEHKKSALEEAMQEIEEDMLGKIKGDFVDYLDKLEKKIKHDDDIKDRDSSGPDSLSKKEKIDRDLIAKSTKVKEDPTQQELSVDPQHQSVQEPVLPEAVKAVTFEDNSMFEIYGDDEQGYEIQHRGRRLPTRFPSVDHADIALKLFQRRRAKQNINQDYIEER